MTRMQTRMQRAANLVEVKQKRMRWAARWLRSKPRRSSKAAKHGKRLRPWSG